MTVELDDFSQYAAARWETLVRASVLLGLPPSAAQPLAVEAIARARGGPDGTESGHDPDVDLFGELVEGHRNDRRRWWLGTPTSADVESREALASVEGELDRLTPAARERVVLRAVAWLPPDQVDAIVAGDGHRPAADLVPAVAGAAQGVPVGPVDLRALTAGSQARGSSRWAVSAVAAVLAVGLAFLASSTADLHLRVGVPVAVNTLSLDEIPSATTTASRLRLGQVPVAWYAAGTLRLGPLAVPFADVTALDAIVGGTLVTTARGRVVLVDGAGARVRIAQVVPGSEVVTSRTGDIVAYVGAATRELTVYDTGSDVVIARVPVRKEAEVVAVDGLTTYVNDRDGHVVVRLGVASRGADGVRVLDAAGGVLALAPQPGVVTILREGEPSYTTLGSAVDLSPDGGFALIRESDGDGDGSAMVWIRDVSEELTIPLGLVGDGVVTDSAFADGESLVAVAREPEVPSSGERADPPRTPRRSDLYVCTLGTGAPCQRTLRVEAARTGPLLAQ